MIIRSRPSRAEERHKQLVNKISGHWGAGKIHYRRRKEE